MTNHKYLLEVKITLLYKIDTLLTLIQGSFLNFTL